MSDNNCTEQDKHHLHVCALKAKELHEDVRRLFEEPARFACTNCGIKVSRAENLCAPKALD